jgi:hypothetical protein
MIASDALASASQALSSAMKSAAGCAAKSSEEGMAPCASTCSSNA